MLDLKSVLIKSLIVPISYIIFALIMGKRRQSNIFEFFSNALEMYFISFFFVYLGGTIINAVIKDSQIVTWIICSPFIVGFFLLFFNTLIKCVEEDFGFEDNVYDVLRKIRNSIFYLFAVVLIALCIWITAQMFIAQQQYLMLICIETVFGIVALILLRAIMGDIFGVEFKLPEKMLALISIIAIGIMFLLKFI